MRNHFNEFSKIITQLGRKHELSRVFNDLLQMGICSFHEVNIQSRLTEIDQENEELYFKTIKPYTREELNSFGQLLGELQLSVYDAPYSDILGEFFTLNITKGKNNGQFFTPQALCELMSEMTAGKEQVEGKTVLDPACGSGRTLLSFAEKHPANHFFGADVSDTCSKMSVVNLFLNGLRGEIAHSNSLSNEYYKGWMVNTNGLGIKPIDKEASRIWSRPPQKESTGSEEKNQLTLF